MTEPALVGTACQAPQPIDGLVWGQCPPRMGH